MMIPELFSRRGQRFLKKSLCGLESWFTDCGVNLVLNSRTKKVMNVMKKNDVLHPTMWYQALSATARW